MTVTDLKKMLTAGRHAHLIGIGGVSMFPLAELLKVRGLVITGSDAHKSPNVEHLLEQGFHVTIGHFAENVQGADLVIRTAAVHDDNPEIQAARAAGIPVFERAQAWGHLMRSYKNAICVAGTHGKTTTTSMLTHIFMQAQRDPTVMIGGSLPLLGAGHRVGRGDTIILESCEYCNSFLNFFPTAAVILDVDADHLDFFKDLADVEHSFRAFAALVPAGGLIVANGDDANTADALRGMDYVRFGFAETNDVCGRNFSADFREFDVYCGGALYCHPHLGVLGRHNAMNALAACAVAWKFGLSGAAVDAALGAIHGPGRRPGLQGTDSRTSRHAHYYTQPSTLHIDITHTHKANLRTLDHITHTCTKAHPTPQHIITNISPTPNPFYKTVAQHQHTQHHTHHTPYIQITQSLLFYLSCLFFFIYLGPHYFSIFLLSLPL